MADVPACGDSVAALIDGSVLAFTSIRRRVVGGSPLSADTVSPSTACGCGCFLARVFFGKGTIGGIDNINMYRYNESPYQSIHNHWSDRVLLR
jgi:hypothetical protein